jgi:hypothetical protein
MRKFLVALAAVALLGPTGSAFAACWDNEEEDSHICCVKSTCCFWSPGDHFEGCSTVPSQNSLSGESAPILKILAEHAVIAAKQRSEPSK